jgi:hypothetical protein
MRDIATRMRETGGISARLDDVMTRVETLALTAEGR